jgi:hypothetical protein
MAAKLVNEGSYFQRFCVVRPTEAFAGSAIGVAVFFAAH